jgi:hypothetical protein
MKGVFDTIDSLVKGGLEDIRLLDGFYTRIRIIIGIIGIGGLLIAIVLLLKK